jgi:hypothetical protein
LIAAPAIATVIATTIGTVSSSIVGLIHSTTRLSCFFFGLFLQLFLLFSFFLLSLRFSLSSLQLPLDPSFFSSYSLLTLGRLLLLLLNRFLDFKVILFRKLDFFLLGLLNKIKDFLLECVFLLHDLLDVFAEKGLLIPCNLDDILEGLIKIGNLKLIDIICVSFLH